MNDTNEERSILDQKPPAFSSWRKIYMAVLLILAVLVILFYLFTQYFS